MHEKYLDMAVSHGMAINLEAGDLRRAYDEGRFPGAGWAVDARLSADAHAKELKRGMRSALLTTLGFAAAGFVLAAIFGRVDPALPPDWGKIFSVFGGLLVSVVTKFDGLIVKHRDGPRLCLWVCRRSGRHHPKQVCQKGTSESNIPTSLGCSRSWA